MGCQKKNYRAQDAGVAILFFQKVSEMKVDVQQAGQQQKLK
jgi:hypothetical protein